MITVRQLDVEIEIERDVGRVTRFVPARHADAQRRRRMHLHDPAIARDPPVERTGRDCLRQTRAYAPRLRIRANHGHWRQPAPPSRALAHATPGCRINVHCGEDRAHRRIRNFVDLAEHVLVLERDAVRRGDVAQQFIHHDRSTKNATE